MPLCVIIGGVPAVFAPRPLARLLGALLGAATLTGCSDAVYDSIELMPPPAVYSKGEVDPFPRVTSDNFTQQSTLFFVTDRRPAVEDDTPEFYANERGFLLRGGTVTVKADPPFSGWDEVKATSLSEEESPRRFLRVRSVDEFGVLPVNDFSVLPNNVDPEAKNVAGREFVSAINRKLAGSPQQDIFIYVHGYNVDFDYSVLSSKELQHYLGYRGAFVTYAWPATPNRLAYFKDIETTASTRKNLREFIDYLSTNTRAENIHVIGYSAGARLAFEAVYDLTLRYASDRSNAPRLGHLVLIGSELDRSYFAQSIDDGLLESTKNVTVYMNSSDAALRMSSIVFGTDRLGQISYENTPLSREIERRIHKIERLSLIDVTDAEGSSFGNGHSYFRSSPWASSDMFVSLIYDLSPAERGLTRAPERAYWQFPPDYDTRILDAVANRSN